MSAQFEPRSRRPLRSGAWCTAALLLALSGGGPARAQTTVDLQLVLAVDASGSVNQYRFELQKRGYISALRNPRVLGAILSGATQSISITMMQWTGPFLQVEVLPWAALKDEASVNTAARIIETTPRRLFGGGTSISGAIDYSMGMFSRSPFTAERRVIDISGDGANNSGRSVTRARDDAVGANVTINGLPILAEEPYLDQYYRDFVIGGPGAFMVVAENFENFADAILKKMITEIAANGRGPSRAGLPSGNGIVAKAQR
jgi:Protein of unknown function (DUF1194)